MKTLPVIRLRAIAGATKRECIEVNGTRVVRLTYPDGTIKHVKADAPVEYAGIQVRVSESVPVDPGYRYNPSVGFAVHPGRLGVLTERLMVDMASVEKAISSPIFQDQADAAP